MVSGDQVSALIIAAVVVALLIQTVADQPGTISCTADPVRVGDNATVTCHFHRNLSKTLENFNMIHYSDAKPHGQPVLLCNWQKNKELYCLEEGVYLKSNSVDTELSVVIQSASSTASGKYACDISSRDPIASEPCTLTVITKDSLINKTTTRGEGDSTTISTQSACSTIIPAKCYCQDQSNIAIAVSITSLAVQIAILICIIGIIIFKRYSQRMRLESYSIELSSLTPAEESV